ncbi:MAG: hypothetical protein IID63_05785 [candidate division Zixibacteria bacterium]|nr:hypothetical protein [candidate division Zixibacteria bacterium]
MINKSLSKETIELALRNFDEMIATKKTELAKLQKARDELAGQNGLNPQKSFKGRLPKGLPQKLVHEAMKKYKRLTIGEVRQKIKEDRNFELRDSSTRRGLVNLMSEGVVLLNLDGYYIYKEPISLRDAEDQLVAEENSDENPF